MRKQRIRSALEILDRAHPPTAEDQALREEFDQRFDVAQQIYDLRTRAGLTQRELAKRVGTTESVICRLEDADYDRHSLSMLRRIAAAVGHKVEVRFVADPNRPRERE